MQTVGRTCDISGKKISMAKEGIGCRKCERAYLRTSLDGVTCPLCGVDMDKAEEDARIAGAARLVGETETGKVLFICVVAIVLLNSINSIVGSLVLIRMGAPVFSSGLGLVILTVVAWAGHRWARFAMILSFSIYALVMFRQAMLAREAGARPDMVSFGVMGFLYAAAVVMLFFPQLHVYLDSKRRHTGGP